ncbi:Tricarboxylate transport protein TctB [Pseudonocardia sp. Ae717_Ps2]|nr:Tricarboxylate transport protein TctB [Pseudonocardia sp. Ae505_Ps2]OLM30643.1 Tricarboxylate transport protein TctB [Pseudonocardia sp. Ae717_Ps2]
MTPERSGVVDPAPPAPGAGPGPRWGRLLFPGALIALSVVVVVASLGLGLWAPLGPGPGFFPLLLGGLLGVLSVLWALEEVRAGRTRPVATSMPDDEVDGLDPELDEQPLRMRQVATIVGSLVVLAILMPLIGYQLSMLLFLVFHLRFVGHRRWLLTAAIAAIGSFGVFSLFTRVLSVNLPAASLDFLRVLGF